MVKVVPKNDTIRKQIKHPVAGAFRGQGSMDWPDDSFTARRIKDGDVTVEKAEEPSQDKKDDKAAGERSQQSRRSRE
jgi:hypothetical protein